MIINKNVRIMLVAGENIDRMYILNLYRTEQNSGGCEARDPSKNRNS